MRETLKQAIMSLPLSPGCYIFFDKDHTVLYIGKSKCIRRRVAQYFQHNNNHPPKIRKMARLIYDAEFYPAESEIDALLLECKLIKTHRPPFNVQMIRDENPVFIHIDLQNEWPGLQIVAEPGQNCFGRFANMWRAKESLVLLNEVWHTPLCGKASYSGTRKKSCLQYHMGKCMAPCSGNTEADKYRQIMGEVYRFLQGNDYSILEKLKINMEQMSESMAFEQAAYIRDRIHRLLALSRRLKSSSPFYQGKHICVLLKGYHENMFLLIYMEEGNVYLIERFSSRAEWPGIQLNRFLSCIKHRNWNTKPDKDMTVAITEIRARKRFIDITGIKNMKIIARNLRKAFKGFIGTAPVLYS